MSGPQINDEKPVKWRIVNLGTEDAPEVVGEIEYPETPTIGNVIEYGARKFSVSSLSRIKQTIYCFEK